jgi:hypothetical protein
MQERSLRVLFAFFGIMGIVGNFGELGNTQGNPIAFLLVMTGLLLSAALVYFASSLRTQLVKSPRQIIGVLYALMIYLGVQFGLDLLADRLEGAISFALKLLVVWYLIRTVRRLSTRAIAETRQIPQGERP